MIKLAQLSINLVIINKLCNAHFTPFPFVMPKVQFYSLFLPGHNGQLDLPAPLHSPPAADLIYEQLLLGCCKIAGKSFKGEGLASFEKLEKPLWRPKGDSLTSLEVCHLLK